MNIKKRGILVLNRNKSIINQPEYLFKTHRCTNRYIYIQIFLLYFYVNDALMFMLPKNVAQDHLWSFFQHLISVVFTFVNSFSTRSISDAELHVFVSRQCLGAIKSKLNCTFRKHEIKNYKKNNRLKQQCQMQIAKKVFFNTMWFYLTLQSFSLHFDLN
jgi:hypothetical protein